MDSAVFGDLVADFVEQSIGYLWGADRRDAPNPDSLRTVSARYADVRRGVADGLDATSARVFCLLRGAHAQAGKGRERPGSVCAVGLGTAGSLPLLQIGPRQREQYPLPAGRPVHLPDDEFNRRLAVRSAHPDFATALVTPLIPHLMNHYDRAYLLHYDALVCVSADQPDPAERLAEVTALIRAFPPDVYARFRLPGVPATRGPETVVGELLR